MNRKQTVARLLDRHGRTYCDELGIDIAANTPSPLFRWLTACVLFSAPIQAAQSVKAAKALADAGWRTAEKMAAATWEQRVRVLNENGYARFDEKTSAMLDDLSAFLLDRHGGDLRRLRDAAERDPARERTLLKEVKGLGDAGVDIFFREAQAAWPELRPFADKLALRAAATLGLAKDAAGLARLADEADFPRLVAALVRVELAGAHDDVRTG